MALLTVDTIEFRNFLSFGDYPTKFKVSDLGPILVLGEIVGKERSSNGAGKTSLLNALLWGLFGKTIVNQNPGDKIINWDSGSGCYVKITTQDSWEIVRTRKLDNYSELSIYHNGVDKTLSTTTQTQNFINHYFNLDFDIFTSSVFCGPRPFMEMSISKRKETLEKVLGLNKLNDYAMLAKQQLANLEVKQQVFSERIKDIGKDLDRCYENLSHKSSAKDHFESQRQIEVQQLRDYISKLEKTHKEKRILPDIKRLTLEWDAYREWAHRDSEISNSIDRCLANSSKIQQDINHQLALISRISKQIHKDPDFDKLLIQLSNQELISKAEKKKWELSAKKSHLESEIKSKHETLNEWRNKTGARCDRCLQSIDLEHIQAISEKLAQEIEVCKENRDQLEASIAELDEFDLDLPPYSLKEAESIAENNRQIRNEIAILNKSISDKKEELKDLTNQTQNFESQLQLHRQEGRVKEPGLSLIEANKIHAEFREINLKIQQTKDQINRILLQENPYQVIIKDIYQSIDVLKDNLKEIQEEQLRVKQLYQYYKYIYRSYSDRRKIKKWLLSKLIPLFNDRIHYYLSFFGLDLSLSFLPTLADEMNKWSYQFCSGGERRRIDVCVAFALHDLLVSIYGPQSNIMVLDEVDEKLDNKGIESFVDLITRGLDASSHIKTILVVSHKPELRDLLPSQIVIKKQDGFSFLETEEHTKI